MSLEDDLLDKNKELRRMNTELEMKLAVHEGGQQMQSDRVEEALEDLRLRTHDLERSNAELKDFASVVSHDLQEPLRAIRGYAQVVHRAGQGRLGPEFDQYLQRILEAGGRMEMLIQGLLAYSRLDKNPQPFVQTECNEIFDQALANLDSAIRDTAAGVSRGDLPVVKADGRQLLQLFQNLIGNALKFRSSRPARIRITAQFQGDEWFFQVQDNGIGFDPSRAAEIFKIFHRLHQQNEIEGTGLGLSTCKKIVERHGGRIWADSEPGEGSTFLFTLPQFSEPSVSGFHYTKS